MSPRSEILHCPLPDCEWSVLRPEISDLDPDLNRTMDALVAATWDMHTNRHGAQAFAQALDAAAPGVRQEHTLFVSCPIPGCRWERDVDLRGPSGFWASLFHVGVAAEVLSVYAERERHLARHDTHTLARALEHLTQKDTPTDG